MKAALIGAGQIARQHLNCLKTLPGVGHYDFLAACTPAAEAPMCKALQVPQGPTHAAALERAQAFFNQTLGPPP